MAEPLPELIEEIVSNPQLEEQGAVTKLVAGQEAESLALVLESLPIEQRLHVWADIPTKDKLDVLEEMRGDAREPLIDAVPAEDWEKLFNDVDAEQLLELADSLPDRLVEQALRVMDKQQRQYFKDASQFKDEHIGHWLNHELLVLPINAKVRDALRLLRRDVPRNTALVFLVNRAGQYSASVNLTDIFRSPDHLPLVDLADEEVVPIKADEACHTAAAHLLSSGFASLPVVDENFNLLGRLDLVTAGDLQSEYYERQVMATAGMDEEEDLFLPVRKSAKSRAVWLGINLITAFLASWFIGLFEGTLQQVVALAVLMPVVASMGGIAGSQTLTLIVRGLALGQVTNANFRALMKKELSVGALNGVIWAVVIGIVSAMWFSDPALGGVIALAILLNIVAAAIAGVAVPVVLDKLKLDPALSGSVILTTVTDIVGFVAFLGIGTLILL
ncbi:magnesium transporter [Aestuariibacter sp. AA17]|uniref:Magnesium transporter n=1 Tax=Fluctibacter corallii TaxID=2984329 RepID=A0ABT3A6A2_9ALTE|nr:magnesium transporter [Aestuariibacter sp. AA17]MCV2884109.1 magnesium transporter [Aestuariibacter sp. AA17]